jgi:hypothetical protein
MNGQRHLGDLAALQQRVNLARSLLSRDESGLESLNGNEAIDRKELVGALEKHISSQVEILNRRDPLAATKIGASEALSNAERALAKTAGGESVSNLNDLEIAGLEAIIEVTGRPALRYSNGKVQTPSSLLGENAHWNVLIVTSRSKINRVSASVGRLALMNNLGLAEPVGTGWRARAELIVTNRHVVEEFVTDPKDPVAQWKLDGGKKPFVDFSVTDNASNTQRFDVADVLYIAPEDEVDLALLKITPTTSPVPDALIIDWNPDSPGAATTYKGGEMVFEGREIYVVGHPLRQQNSELVATVFGVADGSKRWSPGYVKGINEQKYVLEHDCSTLGGNSGSCVFTADLNQVIAIHVGGIDVDTATGKGSANEALAFSRLDKHPAAEMIRTDS